MFHYRRAAVFQSRRNCKTLSLSLSLSLSLCVCMFRARPFITTTSGPSKRSPVFRWFLSRWPARRCGCRRRIGRGLPAFHRAADYSETVTAGSWRKLISRAKIHQARNAAAAGPRDARRKMIMTCRGRGTGEGIKKGKNEGSPEAKNLRLCFVSCRSSLACTVWSRNFCLSSPANFLTTLRWQLICGP